MRDRPIILSGLAAFLALVTLPIWYNAACGAPSAPNLKRPTTARQCVADPAFMRRSHMALLSEWREQKVRDGIRTQAGFEVSLTRTCLAECHQDRSAFCDRCHTYVGLSGPYCWDCHNPPAAQPGVAQ